MSASSGKLPRILELGANLAIIVTSIVLIATAVRYWQNSRSSRTPVRTVAPGDSLVPAKLPLNPQKRTLMFVLQVGCRFCTSSAPTFRDIIQTVSKRGDVDLLAVLPQNTQTSSGYLEGLGLSLPTFRASLSDLHVRGTPTVILCDGAGKVLSVWAGALDEKRGADIVNAVSQREGYK